MREKSPPKGRTPVRGEDNDTGQALRSVYEETVNEAIPPEMLDLLGRLE